MSTQSAGCRLIPSTGRWSTTWAARRALPDSPRPRTVWRGPVAPWQFRAVLVWALFALAGCEGDGPMVPTYPSVAGTYSGAMAGSAPLLKNPIGGGISWGTGTRVTIAVDFTLVIQQNGSVLSGTYSLDGTGTICSQDSVTCVIDTLDGAGTFTGSITEAGHLSVEFFSPGCSSTATWTGENAAGSFTLSGPYTVFDVDCSPLAQFSSNVVLFR